MDVLEDVLLVDNADNDKDLNRTSVYSNDGVDQVCRLNFKAYMYYFSSVWWMNTVSHY